MLSKCLKKNTKKPELKTTEFLKIKTNYIGIGIKSVLFFGVLLLLILIEIFGFFGESMEKVLLQVAFRNCGMLT
ncbi:hypothetical protein BKP44_19350 [Formosa algae]|nr:hypothetical protein BKP44_19350 [Formosa algae]